MLPTQITDPNGNRIFAAYDPLAVSVQAKESDGDGETLEDPTVSLSYNLTDLSGSPSLNTAATRF